MEDYDQNPPVKPQNQKYKQRIKENKNYIEIGTYNVRSLASIERYLELMHALENINCDVLGLAEVRRMGCHMEEYPDYILCYIGETKGLHGVGFLVKKTLKQNIINFVGISERVALLQMKFGYYNLSIIQVYAPTERSSEADIKKFYHDLKKAHSLAHDDKTLVIGDFNAKIGQTRQVENLITGKYGLGQRNERGEKLINYAFEYKLAIVNTYFKKRKNRRWTWKSPDENIKNEIDYIMTNALKHIKNYEVLNNVRFRSDHRLIRTKFLLNQPKKSRKNFKPQIRTPKTKDEIESYIENLKLNIDNNLHDATTVQSYYHKLEEAITHSLTNLDNKRTGRQHTIFSKETIALINKRSELSIKKKKDRNENKELSKLYKETSKAIKRDYSEHRRNIISDNLNIFRSTKRAYKELNLRKTWIQKLESKNNETNSRQDILKQATYFYQDLYKKKANDYEVAHKGNGIKNTQPITPIEEKEVFLQLKQLKSDKTPGPDGITNEALKIGAPILLSHITRLFNLILETEIVPIQWCKSNIILLHKKGNLLDINNYRPISLLASMYKVFSSTLLRRISQDIDKAQPVEQAGFRSGFSTLDHIQALEQVIEKYEEFNKPLFLAFIDYRKAFDSISHNAIWESLTSLNINTKYLNILKYIYNNSTSKVKLESRGDDIKIERGVRQGDPMSPKLFITVLQYIFENLKWENKGIKVNKEHLNHLRFADDIVLISESAKELQDMVSALVRESSKIGLELNATKTKIMTNSSYKPININEKDLEYVDSYIYLGKQISFSKTCNEEEIERRKNIAWKKFWSFREILKSDYSINLKKIVIDTCILPCLLYGCQSWIFTEKTKQKIITTQRAMERSILNIRKTHKIRSEAIRQTTKLTDALTQALKLKWQWAGHVSRLTDNRWTIKTTTWRGPTGKRRAGRPKRRWADDLSDIAGKNWQTISKDRDVWKSLEEAFTRRGVHIPNN